MKKIYLFILFSAAWIQSIHAQGTCNGGTVSSLSGEHVVYTCPGDGKADVIIFTRTGHSAENNYQFIITNDKNEILGLPPGSRADLEGAGEGACRVWGLSYSGTLNAKVGDKLLQADLASGCESLSSNYLTTLRFKPDGGTVGNHKGHSEIVLSCTQDGRADIVHFRKFTRSGAAYVYLITDDKNNILAIKNSEHNFEGAPRGVCRVWGLSYTGTLLAKLGDNAATANLASDCFDRSDNFINVYRSDIDGGMVSAGNGATRVLTVPGDGIADVITVSHTTASSSPYSFIVTDDKGNVLGLPPANMVNVEGAGPGLCRIYGASHLAKITIKVGENIYKDRISNGCAVLSKNYVEVVRNAVDGGHVMMPNGQTMRYTCAQDGKPDVVKFTTNSLTVSTASYRYIVTDDKDIVLAVPPGNEADVDGAPAGACRIYGISFNGDLSVMTGKNVHDHKLATGIYDLSDNYITTLRDKPVGGMVSMPNGQTIRYTCPGDGLADIVRFKTTSTANSKYQYVVTDDKNIILALPPTAEANVEGAGAGACRVWGVSFTGNYTAKAGDNAATVAHSDDCFSLSTNYIEILRFAPEAGSVSTVEGATEVTVTVGDGQADIINFKSNGTSKSRLAWIITDDKNKILALPPANSANVEGAGPGSCRAWLVAYTGTLSVLPGDNVTTVKLSTECYDLSSNFVNIIRVVKTGNINTSLEARSTEATTIAIGPNPATNEIFVRLNNNATAATQVQIITLNGQVALKSTFNGSFQTVNVSHLPSGIYIVNVKQGSLENNIKLFKQ